jgi:hypothetical protein
MSKVTLSDTQKYEFCLYAHNNNKTRSEYIKWIEQKWKLTVSKSTITRILQTKNKRLAVEFINSKIKRHKSVTIPELELALIEFILIYQNKTILSDNIIIEKAKLLANGLGVPQETLKFSNGWLQKFKKRNGIHKQKLYGKDASVDQDIIIKSLPLLQDKCNGYSLDRIYNMNETGLFYWYLQIFFYIIYILKL